MGSKRLLHSEVDHKSVHFETLILPESQLLITGMGHRTAGYGESVSVWDLQGGRQLHSLSIHQDGVTAIVALPESGLVLSSGTDGSIVVWEPHTARVLASHQCNDSVSTVGIGGSGGRRVIAGTESGEVCVLAMES
jgi:WD40 repeat protein